mmetsp:Transcript_2835/g.6608  ORF Transcript_2835/g.6608 Transcript_2835/m.6608 type:complete len:264 (+) Transcript_2835:657-1448(+)
MINNDSQRRVNLTLDELVAEDLGSCCTVGIRRDNNGLVQVLGLEVWDSETGHIKVVYRGVRAKHAHDLRVVKIDCDDVVHASNLEHLSHIGGANRRADILLLASRAAIPIVGNNSSNASSRRPAQSGYHKKKLHEVFVDRGGKRLNNEYILSAYIVQDVHRNLTIRKSLYSGATQLYTKVHRNLVSQIPVAVSAENLDLGFLRGRNVELDASILIILGIAILGALCVAVRVRDFRNLLHLSSRTSSSSLTLRRILRRIVSLRR